MAAEQPVSTSLPAKRLFIVDGHAYAYRAFYAIRQLSSPVTGKATNAIYGFIRMMGKMRAFLQPTHLMVVWDGGLCGNRMELHPDYKIHRPAMPTDLESQIPEIERYLAAAKISSFCREGVEADDWIATLARRAVEQDFFVVIASSDKDFFQLISDKIGLLNPNDKEPRIWGVQEVRSKTGVSPAQVIDWLSLLGDTVDNIPGVPGVGPTTATKLLSQFGSIADIYKRIEEVRPDRIRIALQASEVAVTRNQSLIRLNDALPHVVCCDGLEVKPPDFDQLAECYREWGFKTMVQEVELQRAQQGTLL